MIKSNELRIGNIVTKLGIQLRVQAVDIYNLYISEFTDSNDIILEPILLSPAILVRCGFETIVIDRFVSYELCPTKFDRFTFYKHVFQYGVLGVGQYEWSGVTVKYLHELQNLYFALTGKELEYKSQ